VGVEWVRIDVTSSSLRIGVSEDESIDRNSRVLVIAGWRRSNLTSSGPERRAQFERLRCVSRAVDGMRESASLVICVPATSRHCNFRS